jgi:hypothetical protein
MVTKNTISKAKPNKLASVGEKSFTLIETVLALGIMVVFIAALATAQGNAVYFSEYERNGTKGAWLAKGVMTRIEYEWQTRDFKELTLKESEKPFEFDKEFTYSYEIKEWKLPIMNLLLGGDGNDENQGEAAGQSDYMMDIAKKALGEELLKIAHVQVFWPEGAVRNSTSLTLLLTNQRQLDGTIAQLPPIAAPKTDTRKPGDPTSDPNDREVRPPGSPPTTRGGDGGPAGGSQGGRRPPVNIPRGDGAEDEGGEGF